jgi:hypothetical protein
MRWLLNGVCSHGKAAREWRFCYGVAEGCIGVLDGEGAKQEPSD